MREVCDFPVGQSGVGLEAGCGDGRDTVRLALANPDSTIYAVDLSEGAILTEKRLASLGINNVKVIRGDIGALPLDDGSVDWCYSFGVLHLPPDLPATMRELGRVMKPGARILTYVYSDLREHPFLRAGLLAASAMRLVTRRLPLPVLSGLCWLMALPIYLFMTCPSRALGITSVPYSDSTSLRQVWGGLHDRFGAQIEYRFNPKSLEEMYGAGGFALEGKGHVAGWRGWVSWARKV